MKASELIKKLEERIKQYDDQDVWGWNGEGNEYPIDRVDMSAQFPSDQVPIMRFIIY